MPRGPVLEELLLAAEPEAWSRAGFAVDADGLCRVGSVDLRLAGTGAGEGITSWSLRPPAVEPLDGLRSHEAAGGAGDATRAAHPNGALSLDHVVVMTPDLQRTFGALESAGLELRRLRDHEGPGGRPVKQGFYRLGDVILEVVGPPRPAGDGPAVFWGLVCVVEDIEAAAGLLEDRLGTIKGAVQPGRRIATIRREAGLGAPVALITPEP